MVRYTRENAWSVTAFNSTEIRSVQDNVAIPATAMMVTVCISTDALSSVFISPDLSDTNSFHQCCWSIMPVTACSCRLQQSVPNIPVSFCYIRLIPDTALTTQQTVPVWYRQFWTVCRSMVYSYAMTSYLSLWHHNSLQLWHHTCIRLEGATACIWSVAFLRVYMGGMVAPLNLAHMLRLLAAD